MGLVLLLKMSAISPRLVQRESPDRNLEPALSNLYLSTAADPESDFQTSGIRLTPIEDRGSAWNGSSSPLDHSTNNASTPGNNEGYGTSYSDFLSPQGDWMSDHTSPVDFVNAWSPPNVALAQDIQTPALNQFNDGPSSPQATMNPTQLLTPNLTNNPSPSSDTTSGGNHRPSRPHPPLVPRLITSPLSDTLGPHQAPESARARSPIVKVESYSRGDSPVRDSFSTNRRPSQSSVHLSPGGISNASEEDVTMETEYASVPRSADGSWVPDMRTGQSGLAPDARKDGYILSPNEMDFQRKLAERNADIYHWSEAVTDAHSEAGDDCLQSKRGRIGYSFPRRRAKSTGDPSLQEGYSSLNFQPNRLDVPGPGLVLREPSDYTDDATESSAPVSVNEERWTHDSSEVTVPEPHNLETGELDSYQYLGSPPWCDVERNSTPQPTHVQPVSSTQAIIEYEKRTRENDTISRVATWGTRHRDDQSVRSVQWMNRDGREKKHEKKPSLLSINKYWPHGKSNILKRTKSELSTIQTVPEGEGQAVESRPTPQRKDSSGRKLSLGLSPRPPNYSIGAVVRATTPMAAIGGQDTLSAVSPSAPANFWNTRRPRFSSISEIPRAPGLFELFTNYGGPPVPNIKSSGQPADDEPVKQVEQDHDTAEEEDDDDNDEKGLVMEFPIPPHLPVPTLEGFRTQIRELNPRLELGLIDRFAHEQVRRYKRLIEIKQTHSQDANHCKCKSGEYCLGMGGRAVLLPPRASAQDADSHTQFLIPNRGEAEDSPGTLGETTIATAQFPPGVPYPPRQVKLLPAEFECMVCFHVKKFQKPSDWTKHIYEDVQPFTCTFPDCTDPKSFKRKADWVRHENERHRHLEWWECSFTDCRHKCYRKDNFVQHLVREHKLPEPKVKRPKNKRSSKRGPNDPITPEMQEEIDREREINQLWELVESCRYDTKKSPKSEPCRFCGNVCTNWKKLTVHLAKHMEQMAIPILSLVDERDFPYNNCAASTGNTSTPVPPKASPFGMNEISPHIDFTPSQYPPPYFNTGPLPASDAVPNQLNNFDVVSPYAAHNGGMPGPSEPAGQQEPVMIMPQHQIPASYPPPFNGVPRLGVSSENLGVMTGFNDFSMSPTEMQHDPHSAMYVSNGATNHYTTYHGPMAADMQYNPEYQGQGQ